MVNFMKTAQTIKALQGALESCRILRRYASEISSLTSELKVHATHHNKTHGGEIHRFSLNNLKGQADIMLRLTDREVRHWEKIIRDTIAQDDELRRIPHDQNEGGWRGRHAKTEQQRLSGSMWD